MQVGGGRAGVRVGARWDDTAQNARFIEAKARGLIAYQEVNYPIAPNEDPGEVGLPVLAHTSNNAVGSVWGIQLGVASAVREGASKWDSPWIGEHLAWLGVGASGGLGYVFNPLFTTEFRDIAVANVRALEAYYGRSVALELGPAYTRSGDFESEMHFLGSVARDADAKVILDVTHWTISNRNLRRAEGYGLDGIDLERVVELHVAGMRRSRTGEFWHDAHFLTPDEHLLDLTAALAKTLPNVQAITFEYAVEAPEAGFYATLEALHRRLSP